MSEPFDSMITKLELTDSVQVLRRKVEKVTQKGYEKTQNKYILNI